MTEIPARPWQATVQARLTRGVGVDQVVEIDTDGDGQFTRRYRVVSGPGPGAVQVLGPSELRALRDELQAEVKSPPAGVDVASLEAFLDLVEDALRVGPPSNRFDGARFGAATRDETRGVVYGHVTLGVDVIGTVRDGDHVLAFEQQVVTGPSGVYRLLSPADSASLGRALTANPPADPLWQTIRQDAEAAAASVV